MRSLLFLMFSLFLTSLSAIAQQPLQLPAPLPDHPRLIVSNADWDRLRAQIQADPFSAALFAKLEAHAKQILPMPPAERVIEGKRMLSVSRLMLDRILVLAMVAQITGEPAYADRAVQEMRSAARFSDWHPQHYLDTAEMALAVAIGYDWLYNRLSPEDRAEIATALLEKGINTSFTPAGKYLDWITATNNWNQVCHAGISAAAIALADLHPELATRVLNRAIENVPRAGKAYAPDGVYPEGPMYWNYGSSFHVLLVAALDRLCGQAYGLDTLPGFAQSPVFLAEMTAPSGVYFNFSDSTEGRGLNVPLFWFARRYGHAEWIQPDVEHLQASLRQSGQDPAASRLRPFALLWRDPSVAAVNPGGAPLQWMGRGENPVAVHRSALGDPAASYIAIKGGSPSLSHGHMDAGSFILEADGVRWALDLGMQDYHQLETMGIDLWNNKQASQRWSIFRLGPESHNILRFNAAPQQVQGNARLIRFQGQGSQGHSVFDLTPVYADQIATAQRGIRLLPSRAMLVQDEWTAKDQPVQATWQMLTRAEVTVQPGALLLRQKGQTLTLQILEPANAQIEVKPAQELQTPADKDNPGVSRIAIKTSTAAKESGTFRILAIPGSCNPPPAAPAAEKLLAWPSAKIGE